MELIPTSNTQLDAKETWNKFFKHKERIVECYGNYPELCGILHKYIKSSDHTLILGANNSALGESLYDVGYHSLVTVDSSANAVKKLATKNERVRPEMTFDAMDVTKMSYDDGSFNAVLDRGTMDSLVLQGTEDTQEKLTATFQQIHRVLKLGGRYICVSFAQENVTRPILEYFSNEGWPVRLHKLPDKEADNNGDMKVEFQPPVYVFVCTKFKKMPQMTKKILEVCLDENQPMQRYDGIDAIQSVIHETQQYALVRYNITNRNQTEEPISVVLCNSATNQPRYTLHVVDSSSSKKAPQKFAIFIVPEGRENEWLFDSESGRAILAEQAGFQRLLVACLHRDNTYENLDAIKKELSQKVMELAPAGLDRKHKVPFLTIGDDLGYRKVKYRGNSDISGGFVVEDARNDEGAMIRRLVFLSTKDTVQSEVRLLPAEKPPKKGKHKGQQKSSPEMKIDHSYLATDYQRFQVAGIATIPQFQSLLDKRLDVLIIGLGGGIIQMFMYTHFPKIHLDVVDLDPTIVDVARNWFGCAQDERMKLYAEDGLKFIAEKAKQDSSHRYHDVIFDIDSKDQSMGMSCPPKVFVEVEFLQMVKDKILHPQGVFQLNIVARNKELKEKVIQDIKSVFPTVLRRGMEEHVNEIIYAFPQESPLSANDLKESLRKAGVAIQRIVKSSRTPVDPETDLSEVLEKVEIQ